MEVVSDISFTMGFIFFTQTGIGIMGSSLLLYYSFPLITGQKVRPTDLILNQLVFANNFVLFRRIPQIVSAFGWKNFLSDTECHTHAFWVASGPRSFVPHSFGVSSPEKKMPTVCWSMAYIFESCNLWWIFYMSNWPKAQSKYDYEHNLVSHHYHKIQNFII